MVQPLSTQVQLQPAPLRVAAWRRVVWRTVECQVPLTWLESEVVSGSAQRAGASPLGLRFGGLCVARVIGGVGVVVAYGAIDLGCVPPSSSWQFPCDDAGVCWHCVVNSCLRAGVAQAAAASGGLRGGIWSSLCCSGAPSKP